MIIGKLGLDLETKKTLKFYGYKESFEYFCVVI